MKKMFLAALFGISTLAQAVMYEGVEVGSNPVLVHKTDKAIGVISKELCALRGVPLAYSALLTVIEINTGNTARLCVSNFSGKLMAYAEQDGKIVMYDFDPTGYVPFADSDKPKQLTY